MNWFKNLINAFRIEETRNRILFTIAMLAIFRLGCHIVCPGINISALLAYFERLRGTLLGFYDIFTGGAFSRGTIFGLGVMPYISASIILQVLSAVVPYFQKLYREGEEGRRKITQYTRYGTILISAIQATGVAIFFENARSPEGIPVVPHPGARFVLLMVITLVAGTMLLVWIGELITDRGIGNGISLIIMFGIVARFPNDFLRTWQLIKAGAFSIFKIVFLILIVIGVTAAVVLITQAQRRIPVQYAQRVIGRRIYGGRTTHLPLNMNAAGIIPIIFAQSVLTFPATALRFFSGNYTVQRISEVFTPGHWFYNLLYVGLIIIFAYFYTSIVLNPQELADYLQRYGGFIPGVRPGKYTADYIDKVLSRITLPGALFFAFVALLPIILINKLGVPFYFGGTSLLIVVGVILDTMRQLEAHLLMRHYEGFLRRGRIRGRR